jgi:hypothetical protein
MHLSAIRVVSGVSVVWMISVIVLAISVRPWIIQCTIAAGSQLQVLCYNKYECRSGRVLANKCYAFSKSPNQQPSTLALEQMTIWPCRYNYRPGPNIYSKPSQICRPLELLLAKKYWSHWTRAFNGNGTADVTSAGGCLLSNCAYRKGTWVLHSM